MGASLTAEVPGHALEAVADPMRLAQILTNLTTNALKYAGSCGPVVVRARRLNDQWVRVEVQDHGPGIPPDRQPELFEPFNRLGKEAGRIDGAGIGLAIARKLAELQGGALEFKTSPAGSTFWADLPAAR